MKKVAVIVAGGAGSRMKSSVPKQFLLLQGKPVLWHTIHQFVSTFSDIELIIVLPKDYLSQGKEILAAFTATNKISLITGGETRFHSVKNGLSLVKEEAVVFVHDAVRCMVSKKLISNCYAQTLQKGNAIPAIPATDSIRIIEGGKNKLLNRAAIRIIQTPQTFLSSLLLPAFQQPYQENFTDEASVVEALGKTVYLIDGESENIKITRPIDLIVAERILENRK